MFQFPPFASLSLRITYLQYAGFSHSDTRGSMLVCSSPQIFAAYHVLHRLWKPRHPPCALLCFLFLSSLLLLSYALPSSRSVNDRYEQSQIIFCELSSTETVPPSKECTVVFYIFQLLSVGEVEDKGVEPLTSRMQI